MGYYTNTIVKGKEFDEVIDLVTEALKNEGFGILTEIDVKETFKKKLDVDFKKYKILGACNPNFAHKAIQNEDKIGVLLPCNVIIIDQDNKNIEVAVVNPIESMSAVKNDKLEEIASEVQNKLIKAISSV
ncbi:Uncharacterized conserved protein, DUF302 family [Zhouia amylolytica]|uniref:Uncharacterized conserved protein, DUF302 family n=1 Tax=Zhouia amylolytica TaxID=376730 RepID=A0A1I6QA60_9FLAO|nr:DUF302 domain-containing protein [Zhouia amylolytica]MCQ0112986.1 DUF302 domain-containing protein [Zhouia amylolytica]SFS49238.1 Uncharacterized conserved protein, DUF302 family [Zhouia amylolytica]